MTVRVTLHNVFLLSVVDETTVLIGLRSIGQYFEIIQFSSAARIFQIYKNDRSKAFLFVA